MPYVPDLNIVIDCTQHHVSVVDVAAKETDPHKRLAFVAAFAMSNYSSTIGRIAKPFNPMLVSCQVGHRVIWSF